MPEKIELKFDVLIDGKETALVGRDNGETCLVNLENMFGPLSAIEEEYEHIEFVVPKRIVTINKSFFLGMFELRICDLGKDRFMEKYEFFASDYIVAKIPKYIDDALRKSSMKDILNA